MVKKNGQGFESSSNNGVSVIQHNTNAPSPSSESETTTELGSEPSKPFVVIGGYEVKTELAPLVRDIFKKYGDIVKGSTFSMRSRWCLLELVCSIYKKLEASNIVEITPSDIKFLYQQIRDLQRVKVKVDWLHGRLNWISENVESYREAKARSDALVCEKEKAVETCEKELEERMAVVKKLQERLQKAKDEESAAQNAVDKINSLSLVQGLV